MSLTDLMERIKPGPAHIGERKDGGAILALALHCKMRQSLLMCSYLVSQYLHRSLRTILRRQSRAASANFARLEVSSELYAATNSTKAARYGVHLKTK